jgi:hypothetical protein
MVKLSQSKGVSGEGFTRILGNEQLGKLLSKLQSAVIRSGFELEQILAVSIPSTLHTTLEALSEISSDISNKPRIQVVFKPSKPDPDNPKKSIETDFLIVDNQNRRFMLIEVKEGHVFDTKKADGELSSLKNITSWLAQEFAYRTQYFICCFNQESKETIVQGTKKRFSIEHVMTGREFCELVGLDYDILREQRRQDQSENRDYFFRQILAIPEMRIEIRRLLQEYDGKIE